MKMLVENYYTGLMTMLHNAYAFASTFYFFADTQATAKKIKRACKPTHQDTANMDRQHIDRRESTTGNSTYPKGGVSCSKDSFVVNETLVFQIKFCGKSPALRVAAKRYCKAAWGTTRENIDSAWLALFTDRQAPRNLTA
jgi:hypothetical protein